MGTIKVKLGRNSYGIFVGSGIIKELGKHVQALGLGTDAFVITNRLVKRKACARLEAALAKSGIRARYRLIPDSEKSKSVLTASAVIRGLSSFDKNRKVFIIALGGGVTGDLAGFVASVYKRGIPYIQVPTTLLAQVDSAIGGKTAVDLSSGKNLVGAFYQPKLVLSDVDFLLTLPQRQLRSGLAEVIKYGAIKDKVLFSFLEKNLKKILDKDTSCLKSIVARCSRIKAMIVSSDEREEKGLRTVLNFGHTLGHAIETAGEYDSYNHGEAVALGMLAAMDISVALKLAPQSAALRLEKLIRRAGLPTAIRGLKMASVIKAHYKDKKFSGKKNRFVLLEDIGKVKVAENIPLAIIKEALSRRFTRR